MVGEMVPWHTQAHNQFYSQLCGNTETDYLHSPDYKFEKY